MRLLVLAAAFTAQGGQDGDIAATRTVTAPRLEASVVVDGVLDEPPWEQAAVLDGFRQYEPVDGRPAAERTEVLVWFAPDAIHFGIRAFDREPGTIRATNADRDNIDSEDRVLVYLDTFNDRRRAYFFGVNPLGVQQDGVQTEGAVTPGRIFGGNIDTNPDFIYESSGRLTDEGYVVEMRIPFKTLRFSTTGPQEWGLNVMRVVQRTGYTDTWTPALRANASFLAQSGVLRGLRDLRAGAVWEIAPFVTATLDGARTGGGPFTRGDVDPDAGINLRVGLRNLTLDGTVRPDFSQVESDQGLVTLNERFALFFPEKRPFFLEGIELFATPNQLIYTRRIVDPLAGTKLTGKFGGLGVAYLAAVDEDAGLSGNDALANLLRLRQDFGENSTVGLTLTDRSDLGGDAYNRVAAADVRYVFGRLYYFEAQAGGSWSRDEVGTHVDPLWKAEFDRTGRRWGFNYQAFGLGDDFRASSGFVPRVGIVSAHGFNRFSFYGGEGTLVENVTSFLGPNRIWRWGEFGLGDAVEGGETGTTMVRLRGGWQLSGTLGRSFWLLRPEDYVGVEVDSPAGPAQLEPLRRISGANGSISVTTPTFQRIDATSTWSAGTVPLFNEGSAGRRQALSIGASLRPTEAVRLVLTQTWETLRRERDDSEFARTIIPRVQAEFQPSRSLFLRAIGEYRAERRDPLRDPALGQPLLVDGSPDEGFDGGDFRLDLLLSYEPSPGTVAFLGYGTTFDGTANVSFTDLTRRSDGFFLKLAYQLRR